MYDAFRSVSIIYFDLVKNAVPDNYASAKLAFVVHPFKVNVPKNSSTPYDTSMLKEFITTLILMYLTCHVRYLHVPLKFKFLWKNNISYKKAVFLHDI